MWDDTGRNEMLKVSDNPFSGKVSHLFLRFERLAVHLGSELVTTSSPSVRLTQPLLRIPWGRTVEVFNCVTKLILECGKSALDVACQLVQRIEGFMPLIFITHQKYATEIHLNYNAIVTLSGDGLAWHGIFVDLRKTGTPSSDCHSSCSLILSVKDGDTPCEDFQLEVHKGMDALLGSLGRYGVHFNHPASTSSTRWCNTGENALCLHPRCFPSFLRTAPRYRRRKVGCSDALHRLLILHSLLIIHPHEFSHNSLRFLKPMCHIYCFELSAVYPRIVFRSACTTKSTGTWKVIAQTAITAVPVGVGDCAGTSPVCR